MQAYFPRKVKNSMFRKGISCKEFITVITTFIIALWMVGFVFSCSDICSIAFFDYFIC